MTKNLLNHKEGITFRGFPFWIGLILIAFSIYLLNTNEATDVQILSIILICIGTLSVLSMRGVQFNFDSKKASRYVDFLILKLKYETIDLQYMKTIELRLFSENQNMNMLSISTTVRTRVYELYLVSDSKKKTLIAESTDYSKALDLLDKLSEGLDIVAENKYEEWKERMRERRRR